MTINAKKRGMLFALLVFGGVLMPLMSLPPAHAVPAPEVEFIYDITVRRQYSFANAADAINYAHGICDKLASGASYAQLMGDVKNDVRPNDEYAANYLVSNAVNIFCPAQLWQLRNSAGSYVPPQ
ncbi:MAG TPA: DUF732 domain-containing protein [Mycobacterium sp.]